VNLDSAQLVCTCVTRVGVVSCPTGARSRASSVHIFIICSLLIRDLLNLFTFRSVSPAMMISTVFRKQQQQPFNGHFSRTTWVSRCQKGKTNLDFTGARDSEWQWHQLGHMQVCTSLQTDNHASTLPLSFYRPDALPATQPTASKH